MIPPPNISETDLEKFHETHFSGPNHEHFSIHFLGPGPGDRNEEEEDDGLGYYPDGVKRTLTDEQIAIFRHSEKETLLRERRHAEENGTSGQKDGFSANTMEEGEMEDDGEIPASDAIRKPTGKKKRGQKGGHKKRENDKQNFKPDLRKRTWDKVDSGLSSLDYGEEVYSAETQPARAQRRRISYEDI